jgi:hypothetical protein
MIFWAVEGTVDYQCIVAISDLVVGPVELKALFLAHVALVAELGTNAGHFYWV